ncbi:hypothetical protein K1T71_001301 [Dendrolimus kikuchii]|uniref:Uncharacterized protein n=1 Tax=Dendrolimus kikuchii TaxID=765133 RepID=A0ACC1DHQ3_9NEOP|nr:hypothetical protein K1T71_001301 [Dendrolimus kikuchii]
MELIGFRRTDCGVSSVTASTQAWAGGMRGLACRRRSARPFSSCESPRQLHVLFAGTAFAPRAPLRIHHPLSPPPPRAGTTNSRSVLNC